MIIYLITNQVNGKVYVGKAVEDSPVSRWREHIWQAEHPTQTKYALHNAINKYGISNFIMEVLESDIDDLNTLAIREIYWIAKLKANNPKFGYNMTSGGEGNGGPCSELRRERISEVLKDASSFIGATRGYGAMVYSEGQQPTEEEETRRREIKYEALKIARASCQEKIAKGEIKTGGAVTPLFGEANGMFGKSMPESAKKTISKKAKERVTPESRARVSKWAKENNTRFWTAERKAKHSERMKNNIHTLGHKASEETRQRQREGQARRRERERMEQQLQNQQPAPTPIPRHRPMTDDEIARNATAQKLKEEGCIDYWLWEVPA